MEFLKKNNKLNNFVVTDYTNEDKKFFIGLGFSERIVRGFEKEIVSATLSFKGSGVIGSWNDQENKKITTAIKNKYGNIKPRLLTKFELA